MSEKQKLNLKALGSTPVNTQEVATVETVDTTVAPTVNLDAPKIEQEAKPVINPDAIESKPSKMSFASIRKDVEEETAPEKPTETKKEMSTTVEPTDQTVELESNISKVGINSDKTEANTKSASISTKNTSLDWGNKNTPTDTPDTIIKSETTIKDTVPEKLVNNKVSTDEVKQIESTKDQEKEAIPNSAEEAITKKKKRWWFFKRKKKERKLNQNGKEVKEEKEELKEVDFANYESHFTKESSDFLSKFQKFKYTPKTRIWLIFTLICVTSLVIWGLMVFMPNKHSPEIYKASIMQILWKERKIITILPTESESEVLAQIIEEEFVEEEIVEEIPTITKKEKSKEKLRQHLLDRYRDK